MFHPLDTMMNESRKRDLMNAARMEHLAREATRDRANGGQQASARLLTLVGDLMIEGGAWLKQRADVRSEVWELSEERC